MIYYSDSGLIIRDMQPEDAQPLNRGEIAQGWIHATTEKFEVHLRDRAEGRCIMLTAELDGDPAGYVGLYHRTAGGPWLGTDLPEIVDFNVLEKYRRRGIGSKLMDVAEELAAKTCRRVCIGVGLHSGYGAAQRMYVKRGYVFDGSGVWYDGKPAEPYGPCVNDDGLILYLSKSLK